MKLNKLKKYIILFLLLILFILSSKILYERKSAYDSIYLELKEIEGYTKKTSFAIGDSIPVYLHTTKLAKAQVFRISTKATFIKDFNISKKNQENIYNPQKGFDWTESFKFSTKGLKEGFYYLKIEQVDSPNNYTYIPFLIHSKLTPRIAVIASTNTWQAYNEYGGNSFYKHHNTSIINKLLYKRFPSLKPIDYLPFNRPYHYIKDELDNIVSTIEEINIPQGTDYYNEDVNIGSHLIKGELNLIGFLEKSNYDYNVYSDLYFERNIIESEIIIFNTHSEYWSEEMIGRLERLKKLGKKIIFASGNNIYRSVEYYEWGVMVNRNPEYTRFKTTKTCGAYYTEITYPKTSAFKVEQNNHWVFNNTKLKKEDIFGEFGASGNETDKIGFGSKDYTVLAVGTNSAGPAYMIIDEYENGGWLFNASSIMFPKGLQRDPVITQIMKNLLRKDSIK